MKTKANGKSKLVSHLPAFVTEDEVKQLAEFENELAVFDEQVSDLIVPFVEKKFETTRSTYAANPTRENFDLFFKEACHLGLVEKLIVPMSVKAIVEHARAQFIAEKIRPWVRSILDRALIDAKARYDEVVADEFKRCRELTVADAANSPDEVGADADELKRQRENFVANSPVVQAARQPVHRLKQLRTQEEAPGFVGYRGSIFPFLREHALSKD